MHQERSVTPPPPHPDDHPETVNRNARVGLVLFALYVILYVGFIYVSAFRQDLLSKSLLGDVNLAISYGMGLILAALVLAAVYMILCRAPAKSDRH